jgi:hypothetical protein
VKPIYRKVSEVKIASKVNPKLDRIKLTDQPNQRFRTNSPKSLSLLEEMILETRGGDLTEVIGIMVFIFFVNWCDHITAVNGLQPNLPPHLQWLNENYKPGSQRQFGYGKNNGGKTSVVITDATWNSGNHEDGKIEIVSRINENPALVREAERVGQDQAAQKDINHLTEQLSLGNDNPGIGTESVKILKGISEARGRNEGRVYFRKKAGKIEILAKCKKDNQPKVIDILLRISIV